jgi:hypothetical protein
LSAAGHTVRLIAPQFVKPFVKSNKNDANDAEAICEAVGRPNMCFVPGKSVEQQDIQLLHRVRSRLVSCRTQLANQVRGLLMEYGIILPRQIGQLRRGLPEIREDESNALTSLSRRSRLGTSKACVAVANKNARIVWSLIARGQHYRVPGVVSSCDLETRANSSERGAAAADAGGREPPTETHRGRAGGGHPGVEGGAGKKVVGPQMQRQAVGLMRSEVRISERRACGLMEMHRATCRYRRRRGEDPRVRERLRELAATRRRFGYRRLQILLRREGFMVNHKRVYRLYREEKLGLRRKRGRKRAPAAAARVPLQLPMRPDEVWTMDFTQRP